MEERNWVIPRQMDTEMGNRRDIRYGEIRNADTARSRLTPAISP
jgi:hypothetical protein